MSQRVVELVIGRLVTDEDFRSSFVTDPERLLRQLRDLGLDLSAVEIAAFVTTDPAVWARAADAVDPRLQKASLSSRGRR